MNAPARDKRLVARAFSRAAPTYDSVAQLQREVADRLLQWVPPGPAARVLDLGCGTGHASGALRALYPQAQLLSLDLAEGMLQYARQRRQHPQHFVCGDAEALPLADASVELIFSSLAIQWCEQPEKLFSELARVLRPGGRVLIATLGPATLHELRRAWAAVDDDRHVNDFLPLNRLLEAASGLQTRRQARELRRLEYAQLGELTQGLRALGAHNVNPRRQRGLAGPSRLRILARAYAEQRLENGQLPASYEVYYLELTRKQAE